MSSELFSFLRHANIATPAGTDHATLAVYLDVSNKSTSHIDTRMVPGSPAKFLFPGQSDGFLLRRRPDRAGNFAE
eukprot:888121-Pelagomonas_calceolata.AAC.1